MSQICTIHYFGQVTDHTQKQSEEFDVAGITVRDLRTRILGAYPSLGNVSYQVAVDQQIRNEDHVISESAEIALLPQFSGG